MYEQVIILAAGRGARVGKPKALIERNGVPWLAEQIASVKLCHVGKVVVVLGYEANVISKLVPGLEHVVVNPDPERGQFSSLQCALREVDGDSYILPIDVPCPGPEVFMGLRLALAGDAIAAVPVYTYYPFYDAKRGHPVFCKRPMIDRLRRARADSRLDAELGALEKSSVIRVPVNDMRVIMNLNTPEDWAQIGGRD